MKKKMTIKKILLAVFLAATVSSSFGQNDADPAVTSLSFDLSPMLVGNTTSLTVYFVNNGFTSSIATGSVALKISLPTSGEYKAEPENLSALSGDFVSKFSWTYNTGTKSFFGTSNQPIAPGEGGSVIVKVKGVTPILSANSIANIQRLNPAAYPNENVTNNNLTAAAGVAMGGPLPIQLVTFTAVKQSATVLLNWQTNAELNSNYFDIQYSKSGSQWQSIGTVNAAGNSSTPRNYNFVHNNPVTGANYYRLKLVDLDGSFKNSPVQMINFSNGTAIKILPNPVVDRVYITGGEGSFESVTIFSSEGRLIQQCSNFITGSSIDMSGYAAGLYRIRITDKEGNTEVRSVVKQ
jgi:hypothetical protein